MRIYILYYVCKSGLVEALRIIKCGFPTRCTYERIHKQFGSIVHESMPTVTNLNIRDFTEAIIKNVISEPVSNKDYQLGKIYATFVMLAI